MAEPETQDRKPGAADGLSRLALIAGKVVVAPVTVFAAVMIYFGWARTSTTYAAFGIHYSVLGFSFQDYLLRSIEATFRPTALLLLVILVAIPAHLGLIQLLKRGWRKQTVIPLVGAGTALTIVGLLGFLRVVTYRVGWPLVPMSLGLGVLLIGYAASLWRAASDTQPRPLGSSDVIDIVTRIAFTAFLALTLLWSVAYYAVLSGFEEAQRIAQRPASLPSVVVFTPRPLYLSGGGVRETVLIGDQDSRYYRYDGLHLLGRASDRYILLPAQWRPGMRTVLLPHDPTVRLEFYMGR
ncbi:MAG: hypothetical protein M3460_11700 [Actinomycetota bacterium]|nr:hypothetical protein [Actinomycetota bacterium]